jgi:hypothetical protein
MEDEGGAGGGGGGGMLNESLEGYDRENEFGVPTDGVDLSPSEEN